MSRARRELKLKRAWLEICSRNTPKGRWFFWYQRTGRAGGYVNGKYARRLDRIELKLQLLSFDDSDGPHAFDSPRADRLLAQALRRRREEARRDPVESYLAPLFAPLPVRVNPVTRWTPELIHIRRRGADSYADIWSERYLIIPQQLGSAPRRMAMMLFQSCMRAFGDAT